MSIQSLSPRCGNNLRIGLFGIAVTRRASKNFLSASPSHAFPVSWEPVAWAYQARSWTSGIVARPVDRARMIALRPTSAAGGSSMVSSSGPGPPDKRSAAAQCVKIAGKSTRRRSACHGICSPNSIGVWCRKPPALGQSNLLRPRSRRWSLPRHAKSNVGHHSRRASPLSRPPLELCSHFRRRRPTTTMSAPPA